MNCVIKQYALTHIVETIKVTKDAQFLGACLSDGVVHLSFLEKCGRSKESRTFYSATESAIFDIEQWSYHCSVEKEGRLLYVFEKTKKGKRK